MPAEPDGAISRRACRAVPGVDLYKLFGEAMDGPQAAQPLPGIDLARLYMDAESLERSMKEGGAADEWTSLGDRLSTDCQRHRVRRDVGLGPYRRPIEAVAASTGVTPSAGAGGALQTVVDILGQGAVNFRPMGAHQHLIPRCGWDLRPDWAGALNVAGNVLGDILDLLAGGIVDFAQWARTNILYPLWMDRGDWAGALNVAGNVLGDIRTCWRHGLRPMGAHECPVSRRRRDCRGRLGARWPWPAMCCKPSWTRSLPGSGLHDLGGHAHRCAHCERLAGLNWGTAFALGESVLEKIINAMVSGTFDFLGWVNRSYAIEASMTDLGERRHHAVRSGIAAAHV